MEIITIEKHNGEDSPLINKASEVEFPLSNADRLIVDTLKDKCYEFNGLGLAAPQIGQSRRIAVIYIPESAALLREFATPYPLHTIINPHYEPVVEDGIHYDFEGCYSVENIYGKIKRHHSIKVTFYDEGGRLHSFKTSGFYARVLQHEIDHLNGILIKDRVDDVGVYGLPQDMIKVRRAELSPEKRKIFDELNKKSHED